MEDSLILNINVFILSLEICSFIEILRNRNTFETRCTTISITHRDTAKQLAEKSAHFRVGQRLADAMRAFVLVVSSDYRTTAEFSHTFGIVLQRVGWTRVVLKPRITLVVSVKNMSDINSQLLKRLITERMEDFIQEDFLSGYVVKLKFKTKGLKKGANV